jgi:hypothetical protein
MDAPIVFTLFCLIGTYCAVCDIRSKKIPDICTSVLWVSLIFFPDIVLSLGMAGGCFAIFFFVNSHSVLVNKGSHIFAWGDLLIIPPVVSLCSALGGELGMEIVLISVVLGLVVSALKKVEVPLTPFMFAVADLLLLFYLLPV